MAYKYVEPCKVFCVKKHPIAFHIPTVCDPHAYGYERGDIIKSREHTMEFEPRDEESMDVWKAVVSISTI